MTKKDYVLIATAFKNELKESNPSIKALMLKLTTALKADNEKFDAKRFIKFIV